MLHLVFVCHLDHLTAALLRAARLGPTGRIAHPATGVQNGRGRSGRHRTSRCASSAKGRMGSPPASAASIRLPRYGPWRPSHGARRAASPACRGPRRRESGPGLSSSPSTGPPSTGSATSRGLPRSGRPDRAHPAPSARDDPRPHFDHLGDRLDLARRPVAEKGEGHVQRLRPDPTQRRIGQLRLAPGRDVLADPLRQVERDEQADRLALGGSACSCRPRYGVGTHALRRLRKKFEQSYARLRDIALERRLGAAEQVAQQVHPDQRRAFADVGAFAGNHRVAGDRGAVGRGGR